ncbi:tetratricopeptide repeat protein [Micromonospora andamanensis]|uniref:tetratricopeptide repeat protein n=1 Tax=Micromonospora andamanensis TaxID=1287068 RepID=UPI0019503DE6|nr:tetratricopeptide repeat protein [Micromonospora andamanensis]
MALTAYEQGLLAVERREYGAARELLELAGDDPDALLLSAQLAGEGLGGPVDTARKLSLYERAADLGSAEAAYNLGAIHANARRYAVGLTWYRRAADLGDSAALRMAGIMYATGQGVTADDVEAERLLLAAAATDAGQVSFDLGTLYAGQRHDPVLAAQWFLRAVKEGDTRAQRQLELLVPRLRELSADQSRARTMLGVILAFHLDEQVAGAELLEAAAADGDPEAQRSLAFLLDGGADGLGDPTRAMALYRAAAQAGDGYAAYNLGVKESDHHEAVRWLRRAAEAGVHEAYPHLANHLSELDIDDEALRWYVRGAEIGHPGCMFAAACWYRDGFGGPVDLVQALRWYLAMLSAGVGDGIHEAHKIVPMMTDDQIHEAGRLAGRISEADVFVARRHAA